MLSESKPNPTQNTITSYESDCIKINHQPFHSSVLIPPSGQIMPLSVSSISELSQMDTAFWQDIFAGQVGDSGEKAEILLIGTGENQGFLPPTTMAQIYQAGIGVECMNSGAAARSYNVLISENRRVLALILLSSEAPAS